MKNISRGLATAVNLTSTELFIQDIVSSIVGGDLRNRKDISPPQMMEKQPEITNEPIIRINESTIIGETLGNIYNDVSEVKSELQTNLQPEFIKKLAYMTHNFENAFQLLRDSNNPNIDNKLEEIYDLIEESKALLVSDDSKETYESTINDITNDDLSDDLSEMKAHMDNEADKTDKNTKLSEKLLVKTDDQDAQLRNLNDYQRDMLGVAKESLEEQKEAEYDRKHTYKDTMGAVLVKIQQGTEIIKGALMVVFDKFQNALSYVTDGIGSMIERFKGADKLSLMKKLMGMLVAGRLLKMAMPFIKGTMIPYIKDFMEKDLFPWIEDTAIPWVKKLFNKKIIPMAKHLVMDYILPFIKDQWKEMGFAAILGKLLTNPMFIARLGLMAISTAVGLAFKTFSKVASTAASLGFSLIKKAGSAMGSALLGTINLIGKGLSIVKSGITSILSGGFDLLKNGVLKLKDIAVAGYEKTKVAMQNTMIKINEFVAEGYKGIKNQVSKSMNSIKQSLGLSAVQGPELPDGTPAKKTKVKKKLGKGIGAILGLMKGAAKLVPFLGTAIMAIELATMAWDFAKENFPSIKEVWGDTVKWFKGLPDKISAWASNIWPSIVSGLSGMGDAALDGLKEIENMLPSPLKLYIGYIKDLVSTVYGFFTSIPDKIASIFRWLQDKVASMVGKDISESILGSRTLMDSEKKDLETSTQTQTITKLTDIGIIEHNRLSEDEISNWDEFSKLSSNVMEKVKNRVNDKDKSRIEKIIIERAKEAKLKEEAERVEEAKRIKEDKAKEITKIQKPIIIPEAKPIYKSPSVNVNNYELQNEILVTKIDNINTNILRLEKLIIEPSDISTTNTSVNNKNYKEEDTLISNNKTINDIKNMQEMKSKYEKEININNHKIENIKTFDNSRAANNTSFTAENISKINILLNNQFNKGGHTGDGDPSKLSGVVHNREYVLTEEETKEYVKLVDTTNAANIDTNTSTKPPINFNKAKPLTNKSKTPISDSKKEYLDLIAQFKEVKINSLEYKKLMDKAIIMNEDKSRPQEERDILKEIVTVKPGTSEYKILQTKILEISTPVIDEVNTVQNNEVEKVVIEKEKEKTIIEKLEQKESMNVKTSITPTLQSISQGSFDLAKLGLSKLGMIDENGNISLGSGVSKAGDVISEVGDKVKDIIDGTADPKEQKNTKTVIIDSKEPKDIKKNIIKGKAPVISNTKKIVKDKVNMPSAIKTLKELSQTSFDLTKMGLDKMGMIDENGNISLGSGVSKAGSNIDEFINGPKEPKTFLGTTLDNVKDFTGYNKLSSEVSNVYNQITRKSVKPKTFNTIKNEVTNNNTVNSDNIYKDDSLEINEVKEAKASISSPSTDSNLQSREEAKATIKTPNQNSKIDIEAKVKMKKSSPKTTEIDQTAREMARKIGVQNNKTKETKVTHNHTHIKASKPVDTEIYLKDTKLDNDSQMLLGEFV